VADTHRFRYFVADACHEDAPVALAPVDLPHARSVRLRAGDEIELVDAAATVWLATWDGEAHSATPRRRIDAAADPSVHLVAFARAGAAIDELVDLSIQAGAGRLTFLAADARERGRIDARRARLERIARAAAMQAKRRVIPTLDAAATLDAVLQAHPAGIVLDAAASESLSSVTRAFMQRGEEPTMLIGDAAGIPAATMAVLLDGGWQPARMGPTVLRAPLAAAVAVATVVQLCTDRPA
jgi:16S rRNA (uracil1498-N3)-methyltransferase